nr:NADH dehydrogenase subunit 2 [Thaumaglossa rufocapillata]
MSNISKLMFLIILMTGTMITTCSSSWMGMWMGLEINLLSFIPLMTSKLNKKESEAAMKYFITQAMASTIFMMTIIIELPQDNLMKIQLFSMNSAIFTKMGAAPFHFWFPEVIEGLNWTSSLILLTWQKIAPMTIMMETNKSFTFLSLIMMTSIMISGIMGINQTSMKKILAYSSINHTGWMLGTMMSNKTTWLIYLIIYSAMTANLILIFKKINVINIAQMTKQMNKNKMMKMTMCVNFLSMGGIPPFIGFFPKWVVINSMINTEMLMLTFMMITATLMTIFFYLRIMINSLLSSKTEETYKQENMSMYSIIKMNCLTLMSLMITPLLTIMI